MGRRTILGAAGRVLPVMNIGKIADAIVELAQNPGLREQMGEIGYRRVQQIPDPGYEKNL